MTTYRAIAATETDADSPVTATLVTALADNPKAIAEGSTDADVVAAGWHAYDLVNVGDGADGVVFDHSVDGTSATVETPNFADGYEYLIEFEDLDISLTAQLQIELYRETGAAYDAADTISVSSPGPHTGYVYIETPRVSKQLHAAHYSVAEGNSETAANGVAMSYGGSADTILKARISGVSGSLSGGVIRMRRRLSYTA